jgi:hypothetical protein
MARGYPLNLVILGWLVIVAKAKGSWVLDGGFQMSKKLKDYLRLARKHWPKAYLAFRVLRWVYELISEATNYDRKKLRIPF